MTQPMTPFGNTAVAAPPSDMAPPLEPMTESADNRRKLVLVGAVVGVLILAVAAYFLLLKGGGSSTANSGPVPQGHPAAASGTTASGQAAGSTAKKAHSKPVVLPSTAKHAVGRNPFKALVAPVSQTATNKSSGKSSTGSSGSTSHSGSNSSGGTATTPVTQPSSVVTAPSTQPSSNPSTAPAPVTPQWVELDSLKGNAATFTVHYSNGTERTFRHVRDGADFGKDFKFVDVVTFNGDTYAQIQFGDSAKKDLHKGYANRVQL